MGQVFLGLSAGGWPVAVKVIRAELAGDQEFRIRFSREVAAARGGGARFTAWWGEAVWVGPVPGEAAADRPAHQFHPGGRPRPRVSGLFTALVVDADVDGPVPWLATAYVTGPSLSDAVSSYGPMPGREALALAAGLAEGLSAIHAASVVHCDLDRKSTR